MVVINLNALAQLFRIVEYNASRFRVVVDP
jgi:hypothetical protein